MATGQVIECVSEIAILGQGGLAFNSRTLSAAKVSVCAKHIQERSILEISVVDTGWSRALLPAY